MAIPKNRLVLGMSFLVRRLAKEWIHVTIWFLALIYLIYAPIMFHTFFSKEGKPYEVLQQPPLETGKIRYNIEVMKFRVSGLNIFSQEIFELRGWTFLNLGEETLQTDFERFILLTSPNTSQLFSIETRLRPDVHKVFSELELDLNRSGFYADISKNALSPGLHCIGILFKHSQTGDVYFVNTMRGLVRTPNQIIFEEGRFEECR